MRPPRRQSGTSARILVSHHERDWYARSIEFRRLALALPHAIEKPHFDRVSFRVDIPRGKTIATMLEANRTANVFLSVDEQEMLIAAEPTVFSKVPNKWGDKGTTITLDAVDETLALSALKMA